MKKCLHDIADWWANVPGANLQGKVKSAWDDNISVGGKVGGKFVGQLLKWGLGPEGFFDPKNRAEQIAKQIFLGTDSAVRSDIAIWLKNRMGDLKQIDWRGDFLDPTKGERVSQIFNPQLESRLMEFLKGDLKVDKLAPDEQFFQKIKGDYLERINQMPYFTTGRKFGSGKPTVPKIRTMDDNIVELMTKSLVTKTTPNFAATDLVNLIPKDVFIQVFDGKGSASDFIRTTMPMLIKKQNWDPSLRAVLNAAKFMDSAFARNYTVRKVEQIAGSRSTAQKILDDVIDQAAVGFGRKEPFEISPSAKAATWASRNIYKGMMYFRPGMAILNTTQNINTLAQFGERKFLKGVLNYTTQDGKYLAAERAFLSDHHRFFRPQQETKIEWLGYKMFDMAENLNRGIAFHTGLVDWMEKNGVNSLRDFIELEAKDLPTYTKGMRAGIEAANQTQFLYSVANASPLLSGPFSKLIGGQFMSFPLKQAEFALRQIHDGNLHAFRRYMQYTGLVSGIAWWGLGSALGEQLGGAGSIPEAIDLAKAGRLNDALYVGSTGMLKMLPGGYQLAHGLTPVGGLLTDIVRLGFGIGDDPYANWQRLGRDLSNVIPASQQLRSLGEAWMMQTQGGKQFQPGSAGSGKVGSMLEGAALPVMISKAYESAFGSALPGIPSGYTGNLVKTQSGAEILAQATGFRSAQQTRESTAAGMFREQVQSGQDIRQALAEQFAAALQSKNPQQLDAARKAIQAAGIPLSSMNDSIQAALVRRKSPRAERLLQNAPRRERREIQRTMKELDIGQ